MKKIMVLTLLAGSMFAMKQEKPVILQAKNKSAVNDVKPLTKLNGDGLLSATDNKTIEMWTAKKGGHIFTLKGHSSSVKQLALTNDGFSIYGRGKDGAVHMWETLGGSHQGVINEGESFSTLYSNPKWKFIAMVPTSERKKVLLFEKRKKNSCKSIACGDNVMSLHEQNGILFAGLQNGTIEQWDVRKEGDLLGKLLGHTSHVQAFATDEEGLISGSYDKTVRLWDIKKDSKEKIFTLKFHKHKYWIRCVAAARYLKQKYIVANVGGAYVNIWNQDSGRRASFIASQENPVEDSLRGLCTLDDGQKIAYGTRSGKVIIHSMVALLQSKEQKASL